MSKAHKIEAVDPPVLSEAAPSMVEMTYVKVLSMINSFELRPGERINEVEVAKTLGVSRTPLREALNRLTIEGFLSLQQSRGFFCRKLTPGEIFQLYQIRSVLEVASIHMVVNSAAEEELEKLKVFLDSTSHSDGEAINTLLKYDEFFHETLMELSGNAEMLRVLKNLNLRLRPVRWLDLERRGRDATQKEHHMILAAVIDRDAERAAGVMAEHIGKRLEEIDAFIRHIYGQIYVNG